LWRFCQLDGHIDGQRQSHFNLHSSDDPHWNRAGGMCSIFCPHLQNQWSIAPEGYFLEWIAFCQLLRHFLNRYTSTRDGQFTYVALSPGFHGGCETTVPWVDFSSSHTCYLPYPF
jgi:hypothetical protein